MKNLKEFKSLWHLIKEEKMKLITASILIFIAELSEIFTGHLNGAAVEYITNMQIKKALIYLGIYLFIRLLCDGYISTVASGILQKVESGLSRKLGFYTYKKALNMPAYVYEKTSSGEIINRITNSTDTLSFSFEQLLQTFSFLIGSFILFVYIF